MADQGVKGLLLICLWKKPKRPRHWRARRVTPKHSASTGRAQECLQQEEIRTFQNGFDDPRPSSCQAQSQRTPGTTEAAFRRLWCEPSSGGAGLCLGLTLPHICNMPDTVPSTDHTSSQWPPRQRTRSHRANENRLVWAVQQGMGDES